MKFEKLDSNELRKSKEAIETLEKEFMKCTTGLKNAGTNETILIRMEILFDAMKSLTLTAMMDNWDLSVDKKNLSLLCSKSTKE